MILERFVNGRARANAYLFAPDGNACLVVDPGVGAARRLVERMEAEGLTPDAILLTHGHPDHLWTAADLSERYQIEVYLHPRDWRWLDDPATGGYLPVLRLAGRVVGRVKGLRPRRLRQVEGNRMFRAAGIEIATAHTPGHTAGSTCFRAGELCFTGDTVFAAGPGHTGYPGGAKRTLQRSIRTEVLRWPDDLRLLPGHGGEAVMGAVRPRLQRFAGGD